MKQALWIWMQKLSYKWFNLGMLVLTSNVPCKLCSIYPAQALYTTAKRLQTFHIVILPLELEVDLLPCEWKRTNVFRPTVVLVPHTPPLPLSQCRQVEWDVACATYTWWPYLMWFGLVVWTDPTMCRTTDSDSENETESVVEGQSAILRLDDWLVFRTDNEAALLTYQLRLKWHTLLLKRLKNINKPWTPVSNSLLSFNDQRLLAIIYHFPVQFDSFSE